MISKSITIKEKAKFYDPGYLKIDQKAMKIKEKAKFHDPGYLKIDQN